MTQLSVNLNKIATLRNARTEQTGPAPVGKPDLLHAAAVCCDVGAPGITVHPRQDARHITPQDVRALTSWRSARPNPPELNIEGDARADLVELVEALRPDQFTLVPVRPGELTSRAGWTPQTPRKPIADLLGRLRQFGIRSSVFIPPNLDSVRWARDVGADRVELFTEPFAIAFAQDLSPGKAQAKAALEPYIAASEHAAKLGLGVNAGHDLDEENLPLFLELPHLDEVSIGHAIVAAAVFDGLAAVVRRYVSILSAPALR